MGSSSYPSSCYWGSTVLTTYARAAITSPEVLKEEEGEAVLTVLPAAEYLNRPFPSSCLPPLQSKSKCKGFVMVISSTLHMNENEFS